MTTFPRLKLSRTSKQTMEISVLLLARVEPRLLVLVRVGQCFFMYIKKKIKARTGQYLYLGETG
jgi:hypothetical protein